MQADIETVLRERRRIGADQPNNFIIRNFAEFLETRSAASRTLGLLLAATAAISLVVGGIGIMNIMLVSVTERTHEIGLRMAIGARGSDILGQFLTEAVLLCIVGGLIGLLFGVGIAVDPGSGLRLAGLHQSLDDADRRSVHRRRSASCSGSCRRNAPHSSTRSTRCATNDAGYFCRICVPSPAVMNSMVVGTVVCAVCQMPRGTKA